MLPSLNRKVDERATGDFLKLDNDVFLSKSGLKVKTILFDKSTNRLRSENIFTLIFGKVMEWRAKSWVKNFVEKNKDYLPGAEKFLKNINSSDGVKRSDVMSLLSAAKITRSPIFSRAEENTNGLKINYLIKDSSASVIDFFVKTINPAPSHDDVKIFLDFIEKGSSSIGYGNVQGAVNFLDSFRKWSEKNPDVPLLSMIKGSVNLFHSALIKKITEFKDFDGLSEKESNLKNPQKLIFEKNIKDAFDAVSKAEEIDKLFTHEILIRRGSSSISYFSEYVRNGASAINFSNIEKLESWVDDGMKKFIDSLSIDNQYLIPYLQMVNNQLKIDIKEFKGESYKVAVDRPDFLPRKISGSSDDDAW